MKEMIKRVREEKGGFTLAELLVVVAIIGVLVAIAIPVFGAVTDNAETQAAEANIRVARAEASVRYMQPVAGDPAPNDDGEANFTVTMSTDGKVLDVKANGGGKVEEDHDDLVEDVKDQMKNTTTGEIEITVDVVSATASKA